MSHASPKASGLRSRRKRRHRIAQFPALEEAVLDYWKKDGTFSASVENRPQAKRRKHEFVFYDGPPSLTACPTTGHLLTGYAKDLVAHYQTSAATGRTPLRLGHPRPARRARGHEAARHDRSSAKSFEMGIDNFNDAARASVLKYATSGKVRHPPGTLGRLRNDYRTLNVEYMESVIWAFKRLYDKGPDLPGLPRAALLLEGRDPLSNHELRMDDDVYKDRQDQTVTVAFRLTADTALGADEKVAAELDGVRSTRLDHHPWTLPTNQALAVGPEIEYSVVPGAGKFEGAPS